MPLTNRDKVIIGYTAVMDYLNELDKNPNIKAEYKSKMFGRLFYLLQTHYFPTANRKEVEKFIEDANVMRRDMKNLLSETILAASKMISGDPVSGGFGIDRPLEVGLQNDLQLPSQNKEITDSLNPDDLIDQIIEFHIKAIKQYQRRDAIHLVTNQAMKIVGIKGKPKEEVEELVIKRLEEYGKKTS